MKYKEILAPCVYCKRQILVKTGVEKSNRKRKMKERRSIVIYRYMKTIDSYDYE
jgi:hypothetical protein